MKIIPHTRCKEVLASSYVRRKSSVAKTEYSSVDCVFQSKLYKVDRLYWSNRVHVFNKSKNDPTNSKHFFTQRYFFQRTLFHKPQLYIFLSLPNLSQIRFESQETALRFIKIVDHLLTIILQEKRALAFS